MRIIYFSNQSSEVVNTVIEGLEALGQQVLLLVSPGNYHLNSWPCRAWEV